MIKLEYAEHNKQLSYEALLDIGPIFTSLANKIVKEIKGKTAEILTTQINWVEFKGYR